MNRSIFDVTNDLLAIAKSKGLDPFPVNWHVVPESYMNELASYALPNRPGHWSYGKNYTYNKTMGEMGYSKVYEIVFNNNPAHAYLLDSNSDVDNALIIAHVYGHSDFFKHNTMFSKTDRNMVNHSTEHGRRFEQLRSVHGDVAVEEMMDKAFALQNHIDWSAGQDRRRYPPKSIKYVEVESGEFDDLFNKSENSIYAMTLNKTIPPHSEKDLLWFFSNYAPDLDDWQREILDAIREEAYYFYPQKMTKIMNEGWASFWHATLMSEYNSLTPEEFLDFAKTHSGVVNPGGGSSINPYYLGWKIWDNIKKTWDRYHEHGIEDEDGKKILDKHGNPIKSPIDGTQKIFEVRAMDDDISFIQNYLTKDLIQDMGLFKWGYACDCRGVSCSDCRTIVIESKDAEEIRNAMTIPMYNAGSPIITVEHVDESGVLFMAHKDYDRGILDLNYASSVLKYIYEIWRRPVELRGRTADGSIYDLSFDEEGFKTYEEQ